VLALELLGLTALPANRYELAAAVRENCHEALEAEAWSWPQCRAYQLAWAALEAVQIRTDPTPAAPIHSRPFVTSTADKLRPFVTSTADKLRPDGLKYNAGHTPSKKPRRAETRTGAD